MLCTLKLWTLNFSVILTKWAQIFCLLNLGFLLFPFHISGMKDYDYGRPFEYRQSTLVTLMLRPT